LEEDGEGQEGGGDGGRSQLTSAKLHITVFVRCLLSKLCQEERNITTNAGATRENATMKSGKKKPSLISNRSNSKRTEKRKNVNDILMIRLIPRIDGIGPIISIPSETLPSPERIFERNLAFLHNLLRHGIVAIWKIKKMLTM